MDFAKIRDQAKKLQKQALGKAKEAAQYGASKLAESWLTLSDVSSLKTYIEKSKNTHFKDPGTGSEKTFVKRVIVIFADPKSEFFQKMLYILPVLMTKGFSQNTPVKLADITMKWLNKKDYDIRGDQTLVVFENTAPSQTIVDATQIEKLVNSLNLDINKAIEELDA